MLYAGEVSSAIPQRRGAIPPGVASGEKRVSACIGGKPLRDIFSRPRIPPPISARPVCCGASKYLAEKGDTHPAPMSKKVCSKLGR